jgi:hypothetical protein
LTSDCELCGSSTTTIGTWEVDACFVATEVAYEVDAWVFVAFAWFVATEVAAEIAVEFSNLAGDTSALPMFVSSALRSAIFARKPIVKLSAYRIEAIFP